MKKYTPTIALVAGIVFGFVFWNFLPADSSVIPQYVFQTNNVPGTAEVCGSYARVHITTATDTQIVNASVGKTIRVCDFEFSATAALNFYFESSSTGTCGSPTQIGILWALNANEAKGANKAIYNGFNAGSGNQLCVNTSAGSLDVGVFYDQY